MQPQHANDLSDSVRGLAVGILGGTGDQGHGLARRLALAGVRVLIGSRNEERAAERAAAIAAELGDDSPGVTGHVNTAVCAEADLLIVAVPYDGHAATLISVRPQLAGKIVVDCVNPLGFDKQGAYALPVLAGSAAQEAAELLPDSRVVAAFHHVSAVLLIDPELSTVDTDVLVLGDDRAATDTVQALAGLIPGMRGIYGGRLRNAGQVEALTANLVSINRRYKAHAGLRVTDVD
ncbi:MAG TPA: NADPH-dependent F420 reductase [Mycobacteriales bacterium]|nr:NADPH-dependent F420 reductase [Mycobacteriales bacterium]